MTSTISSKGQITVPAEVRRILGLKPGTRVTFEVDGATVLLRKERPVDHPVDLAFGLLDSDRRVDELLDDMRGPRP